MGRIAEGHSDGFRDLYSRYASTAAGLAYRVIGDQVLAEEVVQEVFLKVFRNIDRFRSQSSLKTWIYRIAVNEVHNYRRWFFRHGGFRRGRRRRLGRDFGRRDRNGRFYTQAFGS